MGIIRSAATAGVAALAALVLPAQADQPYYTNLQAYQDGSMGDVPLQSFHSSPIKAPVYQVNYWDPSKIDVENPYMFMAGRYGAWGPSIVSSRDLSLVWADQSYANLAQTARTWDFRGQRVLSTYSDGRVRIYDQNYKQLYVYDGRGDLNGVMPDSHEAMLTYDGHILMFLCPPRHADLSKVGGPRGGKQIADCTIQEVEPDTGKVVFQWETSSYFKPEDSVWKYHGEDVWDYCHMNAVEKTPEGNYLVSFRHLSTVIMIDGSTGDVIWAMWGKKNMFTDVTVNGTAKFAFQHEARVSGLNRITLFDNHRTNDNGFCHQEMCSRGLEIQYDLDTKTVWMVNEWKHPQSLLSASRGGVQRTSTGNVVVAWGQNPMYTEYTPEGELAMDIQRAPVKHIEHGIFDVITYRIWKGNWVGQPSWGPNISCDVHDKEHPFYVSWNGATEVHKWVLLMSNDPSKLNGPVNVFAQSPRNGFETKFTVDQVLAYGRIAALNTEGHIIGYTPVVNTVTGDLIRVSYPVDSVTRAESLALDPAIPMSAAVSVPTGPWKGYHSDDEADGEADDKIDDQTDDKTGEKADGDQTDEKTDTPEGDAASGKPEDKPVDKPADKPADKPVDTPNDTTEDEKTNDKPENEGEEEKIEGPPSEGEEETKVEGPQNEGEKGGEVEVEGPEIEEGEVEDDKEQQGTVVEHEDGGEQEGDINDEGEDKEVGEDQALESSNGETEDVEESYEEQDDAYETVRQSTPFIGAFAIGVLAGGAAVVGLIYFLRWRKANKQSQGGRGSENKVAYGLLKTDAGEDDDESVLPANGPRQYADAKDADDNVEEKPSA